VALRSAKTTIQSFAVLQVPNERAEQVRRVTDAVVGELSRVAKED